ncbi:MAG: DUF3054 domain-containing protein [Microbacterium sp.]
MSAHPRPGIGRPAALSALIDIVLVAAFAASGRASHGDSPLLGLWTTAWPFLTGLGAGWAVARAWRAPIAPWRVGIPVWLVTVAGGMLLRRASSQGTAWPFVVVASVVLFVLLVGWRLIATGIERRRAASATRSETP